MFKLKTSKQCLPSEDCFLLDETKPHLGYIHLVYPFIVTPDKDVHVGVSLN
jgi:hypothetical protein